MAEKVGNRYVGPTFLVEEINRRAIHKVQHPLCDPSERYQGAAMPPPRRRNTAEPIARRIPAWCRFLNWNHAEFLTVVYTAYAIKAARAAAPTSEGESAGRLEGRWQ